MSNHIEGELKAKPSDDSDFKGGFELWSDSGGYVAIANRACMEGDDCVMDSEVNRANAERLALCWNSHDALLDACKVMSAYLWEQIGTGKCDHELGGVCYCSYKTMLEKTEDAISKAEGRG